MAARYTAAMQANSRFIVSNQAGIHEGLERCVARHAATPFQKPLSAPARAAFEASIASWEKAGKPPLILDSGCGVGLSTLHLAQRHPGHYIIGIDQSADRLARQTHWPGPIPANCTRVRADLVDYWRLLLQAGIHPARHYLLYPNPWPKKHHLGRRWHGHPVFPALVALGGHFECRSNWRIYIEECAAALRQLTGQEVAVEPYPETPAPDFTPITPFEKKYLDSGHSLWRCRVSLAGMQSVVS